MMVLMTDEQIAALLEQAAERGARRVLATVRDEQPLTIEEAAQARGVSRRTMDRWVSSGRIPSVGQGRTRRVRRADLGIG